MYANRSIGGSFRGTWWQIEWNFICIHILYVYSRMLLGIVRVRLPSILIVSIDCVHFAIFIDICVNVTHSRFIWKQINNIISDSKRTPQPSIFSERIFYSLYCTQSVPFACRELLTISNKMSIARKKQFFFNFFYFFRLKIIGAKKSEWPLAVRDERFDIGQNSVPARFRTG